ncbi:hypothetical protein GCK32_012213 [Trichostrongylus colubriformis]|uniref:Secreted protein n=1 Tax=Trichostrongylus colubriformis TaxID=6319 RepID=A0AAN8IM66_TRICO
MSPRKCTVYLVTFFAVLINCSGRLRPSAGSAASWPDGEYCIMPGRSLVCPKGFRMGSVSLAVQKYIGFGDTYRENGKDVRYIRLGQLGGFNFGYKPSDQAYTIQLNACCKSR